MTDPAAPGQALAEAMQRWVPDARRIGVAMSGGGDSMALLHLLADWAAQSGAELRAASVDHGLRPEAADEIALAAKTCAALGIPHDSLTWDEAPAGNLQAAARDARYRLLSDWAQAQGCAVVCLGHTQDDQAETVLLRLLRGSGVDGLAAMRPRTLRAGTVWLRPLLAVSRAALRADLTARGVAWAEDPSNADLRFDRVRVRQAMAALDLPVARLADTAQAMARAQEALGRRAAEAAQAGAVRFEDGDILLTADALSALDAETRLRLLAEALRWVAGAAYRPRLSALTGVWDGLEAGQGATLHGCRLLAGVSAWRVCREYRAVAALEVPAGALWDGRWQLRLAKDETRPDVTVRALGQAGLGQITRPDPGPPHPSLMSTPALWRGDEVLSVPRLNLGLSSRVDRQPEPALFISGLIPH
ncbi:tRNA lysidine(34) synthetase TilS [Dinoroseobacter sp. PD6]|uniref:tRNA lysidine(34) synthetase TilS n=1 Tax=Dinoroseobacter sp. PD6 TaxID=3028384 RepID=UPI00237AF590|nr:tRNA lysidine(34) synthetase TilS [Dinoroseobacter sp. PD6]MDD9715956.1 tRNA lysidine(34) synthetase TilS [Dinoroseobacter sp. PD6]